MATRWFALAIGVFYVLIAILGFIPGVLSEPAPEPAVTVDTLYGRLLGLFPVNILHTIVHLIVGIWGVVAYGRYASARTYSRTIAVIFGVLAIMGLIPGLNTVFGLIPLFSHDIWLHAVTAILAAYFGWVAAPATEPMRA